MPIRLCAWGLDGAMRTALRACTSASPRLPLPSSSSVSSLVAQKLFGSKCRMRRTSASAAGRRPCALRISYSTVSAPGRSGDSSSTSRHNCSAVSAAPWRCACMARSTSGTRCRVASGGDIGPGAKPQQRAMRSPLPQAHSCGAGWCGAGWFSRGGGGGSSAVTAVTTGRGGVTGRLGIVPPVRRAKV